MEAHGIVLEGLHDGGWINEKPDPDPHQSEMPDPGLSEKPDQDPHKVTRIRNSGSWSIIALN